MSDFVQGGGRRADRDGTDRPGGGRRRRAGRAGLRAAPGRQRPAGDRAGTRAGAGRAGRPARRRRLRVRHRPDRAHHARPDRRGARRGRRGAGRLARPDPARPGLPGVLPGRLDARRDHRHHPDGGRDLPGLRAPGGRRLPALRRLRPGAVAAGARPTSSTATWTRPPTCSPATCSGCSAAAAFRRLQTEDQPVLPGPAYPADLLLPGDVRRASRRTTRWPSTRSSRTSTRWPGSTSRAAASTRSPGRWPARPRSTACRSGTTPR